VNTVVSDDDVDVVTAVDDDGGDVDDDGGDVDDDVDDDDVDDDEADVDIDALEEEVEIVTGLDNSQNEP
jgi:hypothetical protein